MDGVTEQSVSDTVDCLDQLGEALRGDYMYLGKHIEDALVNIADILHGRKSLAEYRNEYSLCAHGLGHFEDYCGESCLDVPK